MNENRVLVWVTYTSIATMLTLILMIVYENINIDDTKLSEWLAPSTIATLIGGLGGALAGTWLSGRNATKQWEKQEGTRRKNQEDLEYRKKFVFNTLIHAELRNIEINTKALLLVLNLKESVIKNVKNNKHEVIKLFYQNIEDISYCVTVIEAAYKEAKSFLYTDTIDYDTFYLISETRIHTHDFYILYGKKENNIKTHMELLEQTNNKYFEMVVIQTMVGMVHCRETILNLNEFLIDNIDFLVENS